MRRVFPMNERVKFSVDLYKKIELKIDVFTVLENKHKRNLVIV